MIESSKHTATNHNWRSRAPGYFSRILGRRSSGAVTLDKANSHGFIMTAVAQSSVGAMLQRVGVAPEKLAEIPLLHDDLVRKCTKCENRDRCREWLSDPDRAPDAYREFCDNAEEFEKLRVDQ